MRKRPMRRKPTVGPNGAFAGLGMELREGRLVEQSELPPGNKAGCMDLRPAFACPGFGAAAMRRAPRRKRRGRVRESAVRAPRGKRAPALSDGSPIALDRGAGASYAPSTGRKAGRKPDANGGSSARTARARTQAVLLARGPPREKNPELGAGFCGFACLDSRVRRQCLSCRNAAIP